MVIVNTKAPTSMNRLIIKRSQYNALVAEYMNAYFSF